MCVTSPPYYGLRDYGHDGQIGLEKTPEEYVEKLVQIFREVRRVLRADGTLWLNIGDSYASGKSRYSSSPHTISGGKDRGDAHNKKPDLYYHPSLKDKDLIGIPWMLAFALRADGWWLRQDIIWHKPNPMPESVTDRCTKSHEYIFLLTKSARYYYDAEAVKERANYDGRKDSVMKGSEKYANGFVPNTSPHTMAVRGHERWQRGDNGEYLRNRRSVWTVTTQPFKGAHFAVFPQKLIEPCIKAGTSERGVCSKCGASWDRVTKTETSYQGGSGRAGRTAEEIGGKWGDKRYGKNILLGPVNSTQTTGWRPTCDCNADTVPAIVLDPFAGSGTTLIVSEKLGRDSVGIELSEDYCKMIQKRIDEIHPSLFNELRKTDE
jgi:DNA modification methylase